MLVTAACSLTMFLWCLCSQADAIPDEFDDEGKQVSCKQSKISLTGKELMRKILQLCLTGTKAKLGGGGAVSLDSSV